MSKLSDPEVGRNDSHSVASLHFNVQLVTTNVSNSYKGKRRDKGERIFPGIVGKRHSFQLGSKFHQTIFPSYVYPTHLSLPCYSFLKD